MRKTTMAIRWSDRDRYFGPFTYARGGWCPLACIFGSGDDGERRHCSLRLSGFGHTLIVRLPPIIRPWRRWVDTSKYGWSDNPRGGYWETGARKYGFSVSEGHLSVALGRVTNDSSTEQSWGCFLPWTQWRHVRHSFYGLDGEHFETAPSDQRGFEAWEETRRITEACPGRTFAFADFDGEELAATTKIEERQWKFGTGSFRWLSWFRRDKVCRSLDIRFSGETGRRKGSWKGGTLGHSIDMLPGELHEAAFRRYCAENNMTFLGEASSEAPEPQG